MPLMQAAYLNECDVCLCISRLHPTSRFITSKIYREYFGQMRDVCRFLHADSDTYFSGPASCTTLWGIQYKVYSLIYIFTGSDLHTLIPNVVYLKTQQPLA